MSKVFRAMKRVKPFTEEQAKAGKENTWPGRGDVTESAKADEEEEGGHRQRLRIHLGR
jgi:hypothetical protein